MDGNALQLIFKPLLDKFEVSLQALPHKIPLSAYVGPLTVVQGNKLESKAKQYKTKKPLHPGLPVLRLQRNPLWTCMKNPALNKPGPHSSLGSHILH